MKNTGQKPRYAGTRSPLDKVAQFHPYHVERWEGPNVALIRRGHICVIMCFLSDSMLAFRDGDDQRLHYIFRT